ncbi:hypothetical protein JB92DRAFT_3116044 [Gautieria morchelliformis]|nr:hypothetical protein JB92DRAFT_3116044 [Gautieria morchelliformis]
MDQYPYGYHDSLDNLDFTFEQVGHDLNTLKFAARPEGDPVAAFTFEIKHTVPTLTVQLTREMAWRSLYPELKGPDMCLIYFGPDHDMGRFAYGIIAEQYMSKFLRRPNANSSSIYFTAQNEREYKWKQTGDVLECIDTHGKKWVAQYDTRYWPPQMRIKGDGVLICTEIFVTWYLYQNAKRWKWEIKIGKEQRA